MTMRKNLLMGMGLALSLAGAAFAQQGGRPEGPPGGRRGPGMMEGRLFQGITLSDAQKTQLQQLRESERSKMEANRGAMRAEMDSARAARERGDTAAARAIWQRGHVAMEQHRDAAFAAIRNILTADQRTQFDQNVAAVKTEMENRMRNGGPDMRGDRPTRGARRALRGALFQNITLTDAQKAQLKQLRASQRQQQQATRQQRLAAVRDILTPDQRTQFDKNVAALKTRFQSRGRRGQDRQS